MIVERPVVDTPGRLYLDLLPDGDLIEICTEQSRDLCSATSMLADKDAEYRYAREKWSIKEVLGHLTDTERVSQYRLLCAARADPTPMPSFDEERYVLQGRFHHRYLADIIEEWQVVRQASIALLKTLTHESLQNTGTFRNRRNTALTVACVIPAHVYHHMKVLEARYGITFSGTGGIPGGIEE